jgi:hypothetical protein
MLMSNLFDSQQYLLVDAAVSSSNHYIPEQVWHYQVYMVQLLPEAFCFSKTQVCNSVLILELLFP